MQAKDLRLELSMWITAWDRYALGAAMVEQLTFTDAMKHKAVVTEVACHAMKEGKRSLLGVLYDEVARQFLSFSCVTPVSILV